MRTVIFLVLACVMAGCILDHGTTGPGDNYTLHPRVTLGETEYTEQMIRSSVPDTVMFPQFCAWYDGRYTDSLKACLATWAADRVEALGGNRTEMENCLEATGQLAAGAVRLPIVVEQAKYEGKPCWIFQFVWGVNPDDLAHYRCFVMEAATADTLFFITCR